MRVDVRVLPSPTTFHAALALAAMHRRLGRLQVRVRCQPSGVQGRIGCQVQEKDEEL